MRFTLKAISAALVLCKVRTVRLGLFPSERLRRPNQVDEYELAGPVILKSMITTLFSVLYFGPLDVDYNI